MNTVDAWPARSERRAGRCQRNGKKTEKEVQRFILSSCKNKRKKEGEKKFEGCLLYNSEVNGRRVDEFAVKIEH